MPKKKTGKGGKTAKVRKNVRAKLQPVIKAAEHPVVADLIAAGIAAASTAIANSRTVRAAAARAGEEAEDAAEATARGARRTGSAARAIAIDFARRFIDAYEAGGNGARSGKSKKGKSRAKGSSAKARKS